MDRSADFEMPPPKRIRLQYAKPEAAIDPTSPVDDTDDLSGPSLMQPQSATKSPKILAPVLHAPAFQIEQKPFHLPGLVMLDEDPTYSNQPSEQKPQTSTIPEAEQSSSIAKVEGVVLEDGQKYEVNGGQDSTDDDKRMVPIETIKSENASLVPSEILADKEDIAIAKVEDRGLGAAAPASQEVTGSRSEMAQTMVDWHSSGTIIDSGFWLPGFSMRKTPSTAPESRTGLDWHSSGTVIDNGIWLGARTIEKAPSANPETQNTPDWHSSGTVIDNGIWVGGYATDKAPSTIPEPQTELDWHSSGTIIDTGLWLGGYSIDKAPSKAPNPDTARVGTSAAVWQDKDVDQVDDDIHQHWLSGTTFSPEQNKKTVFEKPASANLANPDEDTEEAEFELDSSPLESDSSSDDSTDTSSSDDSDADDYEMLSPAEQARRLMAEDGGSDGDGKGKGGTVIAEVPRTTNEKPDEFVKKPNVIVTEDMKIEELGLVENTVENLALIKANTSGEYQVLESGSLLCLQDRSVIGVISETLGRVQQPYYSVRFTNAAAIAEAGIEKGTKIMYVVQHSTTVFTQPLRAFKGSDASNLHDEEVSDDELEFSDDEAEAEHKRQIKQQRMTKRNNREGQLDGYSRGPQQRPGGPGPRLSGGLHPVQEHAPNSAEAVLNYDDTEGVNVDSKEDGDGLYTPLARPSNLHEILSGRAPPASNHEARRNVNRGRGDSRGAHRGRGIERGMRDSERGGIQKWRNRGAKGQAHEHPIPSTPQRNSSGPSQTHGLPPRPGPEANSYQQSTPSRTSFPYPTPQQSPIPTATYQNYQQQHHQSHTHPGYPPQYPNAYNQSSFHQPPYNSYPSNNIHQQNYSQYHQPQQPIPHQGFPQPFASQPDVSFSPPQSQYPASIPPGAHINPNYFKQQGQPSSPQTWHQGYNQQQQQQFASPASSVTGPPAPGPHEARLQDLLRGFGRGGG